MPNLVIHLFNPRTQESAAGGFLEVWGHPGLHSEFEVRDLILLKKGVRGWIEGSAINSTSCSSWFQFPVLTWWGSEPSLMESDTLSVMQAYIQENINSHKYCLKNDTMTFQNLQILTTLFSKLTSYTNRSVIIKDLQNF